MTVRPGSYAQATTLASNAVSVPGGTRLAVYLGEGLREEVIVSSAVGSGKDGLNSSYSGTNGSDGRHFLLNFAPIISNRTVLFKNGIPLVGHEESISSVTTFNYRYDYRIEISSGKLELQGASLVDQGGSFYTKNSLNIGTGTISSLSLDDVNAPTETWTIRCTSVRRDGYGVPIDGYAKFVAQGSVSGVLLDTSGNQVIWQSNGTVTTNSILKFAINEGVSAFREGDKFVVKVKGGALTKGDTLSVKYIAVSDINSLKFFTDFKELKKKHGSPSLTNRLSLGAQLAFANGPPGIWTCQCAPAIPRRLSYDLKKSATGNSSKDDLEFRLPLDVVPDVDSNINFFVKDPVTQTETQILPNKVDFYNSAFTSSPTSFENGSNIYSYTVILDPNYEEVAQAEDGVLTSVTSTTATLSSSIYMFTSDDVSATRKIKILTPNSNAGTYDVVSVSEGVVTISNSGGFTSSSSIKFQVLDSTSSGAVILFTKDLALSAGQSLRATIVDTKDASFFDAGWQAALQSIEKLEVDMIVPVPSQTISAIFASAKDHCLTMSQQKYKKERHLYIGGINGLLPDNVIGTINAAVEDIGVLEGIQGDVVSEILAGSTEDLTNYGVQNSYGNTSRVVYVYPDQIVVSINGTNTIVDGFFAASAVAGYLSKVTSIQIPLTNKVVTGFTILSDRTFRPVVVEQLLDAGVCLLEPVNGGANVVWGRTTTLSPLPEDQEISIVFIKDRLAKGTRAATADIPGTPEDASYLGTVTARADGIAKSFLGKLITNYRNLSVAYDPVEPRQINIYYEARPIYGNNWVYTTIGVGNF